MTRGPDRVGGVLATTTALMPLLPYGPVYLGLGRGPWVEAAMLLLVGAWVVDRLSPGRVRRDDRPHPDRGPVTAIVAVWVASVLGAGLLGLLAENRLGSPVFAAHVAELPARLFGPFDQEFEVLYPLRMTLVYLLGPLAVILVRDLCRRDERRARSAVAGWGVGFGLVGLAALFQYFTGAGLHPDWVRMEPGVTRAHATLDDPNALGAYLALGLAAAIGTGLGRLRAGAPVGSWLAIAVVLGAAALTTTMSRSAWIAVAVVTAAALATHGVSRLGQNARRRGAAVALLLATGLAVVLWMRMPPDTGSSAASVEAPSGLGDRAVLWGAALEMGADHPLTGVGLGRYRGQLRAYEPELGYTENTHSFPLQVLAEMGGLGLVALLLVTGALGLELRAAARPGSEGAPLVFGGVAGLGAFAITQVTGNALLLPSGQVLPGLLVGALLAVGGGTRTGHPSPGTAPAWRWAAPVALGLLAIFAATAALREGPPRTTDRWGYAWGLHAPERPRRPWPTTEMLAAWSRLETPERDADLRRWAFRWTRDRALLELRPPDAARGVLLPMSLPETPRGDPVTVWVFTEGTEPRTIQGPGRHVVELPIPTVGPDGGRLVRVRLEVDGAFRPALDTDSTDDRLIGAALWPVAYEF